MKRVSLKSLPEAELAAFQTRQQGNNCAIHAAIAALKLLEGLELSPQDLSAEVDRLWWHGHFYRVFPGWGVTPCMQARLINYLSRQHNLNVHAHCRLLTHAVLMEMLEQDQKAVLVTLTWLQGKAPALYHGTSSANSNATHKAGGHTMLLAAYDPAHRSGELTTPWGFINSWAEGGSELFWMEDHAFRKSAFGAVLPLNIHPSVIIQHTSKSVKVL